jgi:hypothetical protein
MSVVRVMKYRWMRWTRHVARMEEMKNAFKVWFEELKTG